MAALPLCWTSHPARENPGKLAVACLGLLLGVAVAWLITQSIGLTFAAVGFLLCALAPALLPVTYRLTEEELEITTVFARRRRRWSDFRRAIGERRGVLLSPYARRHFLDEWRGEYLRQERHPRQLLGVVEGMIGGQLDAASGSGSINAG